MILRILRALNLEPEMKWLLDKINNLLPKRKPRIEVTITSPHDRHLISCERAITREELERLADRVTAWRKDKSKVLVLDAGLKLSIIREHEPNPIRSITLKRTRPMSVDDKNAIRAMLFRHFDNSACQIELTSDYFNCLGYEVTYDRT